MFEISRQVDYSIQLLARLGKLSPEESLSLKMFSEESNISFLFLQKIARSLKQAGLITAHKGTHGGYKLSRPVVDISIKSVIEAVEGPFGIVDCAKGDHACFKSATCTTKQMWLSINKDIVSKLETTSIAHFSPSYEAAR